MKSKCLILIIIILLITGCGDIEYTENENDRISSVYNGAIINIYVDSETCVEYFRSYQGGVTVMYNQYGSIKLNDGCLNNKNN